jgi:hypothetical protein
MSGVSSDLSISYTVGGVHIPASGFEVVGGSYGSIGHATVRTSILALETQGVDLVQLTSSAPQVPVTVTVYEGGYPGTVFGGEATTTEWDFRTDTVTLHSRDWAGVLVDQKRILARDVAPLTAALGPLSPGQNFSASGVSTMNRNVSQVVTDIANQFGFTPVVQMAGGTDVVAGSIYGSADHVFMTIPQNLWSVLNTLARDTGNEVYVTPDKRLVFGAPGAGLQTLQLSWNLPELQGQSGSFLPCDGLSITHNPRRNNTFRVLVISYDPAKAIVTLGRATYIGDSASQSSSNPALSSINVSSGLHTGSDAVQADGALANVAGSKTIGNTSDLSHIQLYTFHWDGLTADQANARAAAIATDISKRLLLMRCRIDGYPAMVPTQPLTLQGQHIPANMSGNTWYVSGYRHSFVMPTPKSKSGGFWTEISALDLPNTALASSS